MSLVLLAIPVHQMLRMSALWVASMFVAATAHAAGRPNVIVIMTDDQGYGDFSCHGHPFVRTPNVDALARESIRLTDFHVAPMCTPTRAQLMTGLDAFRTRAINVSSGRTLMKADLPTLADVLADGGYRTGLFGKWHLGDNYPFRPMDRGFEESLWFPSSHVGSVPDRWNNDYFDDTFLRGDRPEKTSGYCTDVFFDAAMGWVDQDPDDSRPFFAYIAPNAAHWPWFVPRIHRDAVRRRAAEHQGAFDETPEADREDLISFLAMGENIDQNVGRLDEWLRRRGRYDDTIVVFLTDNGSTFGDRSYNAGMRGRKTQLWEGGHRVPCFIRWPAGGLGSPRDVGGLTQCQDLLPTLAELVGIEVPPKLDGRSLVGNLRGESTVGRRTLVINYSRMPGMKVNYKTDSPTTPARDGAAVLRGPWRLLNGRRLYNVEIDPHQDRDVAVDHPDIVASLNEHLDRWWAITKRGIETPERVTIGSDAGNPSRLTACEWWDVFVDQQAQVRRGERKNGTWHLRVARPGRYRFTARRWPADTGLSLDADADAFIGVDGTFPAGVPIPIAAGRLEIHGQAGLNEQTQLPAEANTSIVFECDLKTGPIEVVATFLDVDGADLLVAYYLTAERLAVKSRRAR